MTNTGGWKELSTGKGSGSWNGQARAEATCRTRALVLGSSQLLPQPRGTSPADPGNLGQVCWTLSPPLWLQHPYIQVIAKADHLKVGYPKPKVSKTRRGSQSTENLGPGGPSGCDCHMPGTHTGWEHTISYDMLDIVPSEDSLDPVVGRRLILLGLGLPGTGYHVNSKPGNFPGEGARSHHLGYGHHGSHESGSRIATVTM